jgi:flagellar biosynthetic protein FliR
MPTLVLSILAEVIAGFIAGFFLKIIFDVIVYTAELISLTMGLSMAMVFDPLSQNQSTVIGQSFSLMAVVAFLSLDGDHLILEFVNYSLVNNSLGTFSFSHKIIDYILLQMKNFFILGFTMAFPVLAVGLLGDVIFGMLM